MIKLHKEGNKIICGVLILLLIINFGIYLLFPSLQTLAIILGITSLVFLLLVLNFFRNPIRTVHADKNQIIAPCDGKIVVIEEVEEPEYFKDKRLLVSIFMSPTNVHVNRSPIQGIVKYVKYHPGKYLVAWKPKSSLDNERNSVVIEYAENAEVLVRQIAGAIARRIVNYLDVGDQVFPGKELGFIKFGSRVDLFLPLNSKINVDLKEKVRGGETVIGELAE